MSLSKVCYKLEGELSRPSIHRVNKQRGSYNSRVCRRKFIHLTNKGQHQAACEKGKTFSCPRCDMTFNRKHNRDRHMIVHTKADDVHRITDDCRSKDVTQQQLLLQQQEEELQKPESESKQLTDEQEEGEAAAAAAVARRDEKLKHYG